MTDVVEQPDHGKPKCGGNSRAGNPCQRPAGWGTPHPGVGCCKLHGGSTPTHIAAAQSAIARSSIKSLGLSRVVEPQAALLEELHRSAGAVAWLDVVVQELGLEDVTWGQTKATVEGATFEAGVNVWVRLWTEQRRHYLEVTKACVAAGIAEQRIQLEQDKARMVAVAVGEGLDAISASAEQREVFTRAMLGRMRLVDAGAGGVVAGAVESS